jgi:tRNA threonylcarbamoyladenosine biosynthesis protein TsaE
VAEVYQLSASDEAATQELGERLASLLFPGAIIALEGPLGAGKTRLVRAIAHGLGIGAGQAVTSPTFVLIQEYEARLPIFHFDAYRLAGEAEFFDLGVHEYFQGNGVCLVEWADRVPGCLPAAYLRIRIHVSGPESREFLLEGFGRAYENIVHDVRSTALSRTDKDIR